jgi:hypothetical protein
MTFSGFKFFHAFPAEVTIRQLHVAELIGRIIAALLARHD